MSWRGPEVPGEFPTLGYQVADFIQAKCVVPDGEHMGEPYVLTDEMLDFVLHFYRLNFDPVFDDKNRRWAGSFYYERGSQLCRPQKWGKGPFGSAIICAEADGPALFDGWDAQGDPVGRPWPTPLIQVAAISEDQTGNVWGALQPMIELGDIAADIPDTGLTRINLPRGGKIEPVTSAARSRLGQRVTFLLQDQTESWLQSNGGRELADNQRRNIAGMGGRWMSTPNAWDPREDSVAQWTSEHEHVGVYHDDVEPAAGLSVRNKQERRRALKTVYGDSWWVDLDRIDAEIAALLSRDAAQAERWFLNRKLASEDAAFDPRKIDDAEDLVHVPEPGGLVVIGVDGARYADALGIVATEVETGYQWPLGIWERPESAPDDYEHPFEEIDGAMLDAFDEYEVWRVYVDPQWIDYLMEKWQGRWGAQRVLPWLTNRPKQIAHATRNYTDAFASGDISHSGDEVFVKHLKRARKYPLNVYDDEHRRMHSLSKDRPDSPQKIDAAMAGNLSWEARGDAIAAGAKPQAEYQAVGWA